MHGEDKFEIWHLSGWVSVVCTGSAHYRNKWRTDSWEKYFIGSFFELLVQSAVIFSLYYIRVNSLKHYAKSSRPPLRHPSVTAYIFFMEKYLHNFSSSRNALKTYSLCIHAFSSSIKLLKIPNLYIYSCIHSLLARTENRFWRVVIIINQLSQVTYQPLVTSIQDCI